MTKFLTAILVVLTLAGVPSMAQAADWSYVEVAYSAQDLNNRSSDLASLNGSFEVGEHVFFQGGYAKGLDADLEAGVVSAAVGLHDGPLYGKVIVSAVVANREDFDKYAFSAEVGARTNITENLELRGGVIADGLRQQKFDDVTWLGTVGLEYAFTDAFRVGVDVKGKSDYAEGRIGARWYF